MQAVLDELYQNARGVSVSLRKERPTGEIPTSISLAPYTSVADVARILQPLTDLLPRLADARRKLEAQFIYEQMKSALMQADLRGRPALSISDADDGATLIEWIFRDRRLGFNIEVTEGESGWYYASSRASGGQCASGNLSHLNASDLVRWATDTK